MKTMVLINGIIGKLMPENKGWLFSSLYGEYSDSPRVVSELLHERRPDVPITWIIRKEIEEIPDYIKRVDFGSAEAEMIRSRTRVIVDNIYGESGFYLERGLKSRIKVALLLWIRRRKKQKIYTSWHGIPLKRLGRDEVGKDYIDFKCNNITMFVNSKFEEDILRHATFGRFDIHRTGMPRNDVLFNNKKIDIRKKLGIPNNKKIVLFAPTFRKDKEGMTKDSICRSGINQLNEIDINSVLDSLNKRFDGEWALVGRFHSQVSDSIDWEQLLKKTKSIYNGNTISDMADLLSCTDALITDASSCMFDFMLTHKPCLLYFPDVDNYQSVERGLYMDINSLPFPLSKNNEQLIDSIDEFDESDYKESVCQFIDKIGCIDDGHSGERMLDYILMDLGMS